MAATSRVMFQRFRTVARGRRGLPRISAGELLLAFAFAVLVGLLAAGCGAERSGASGGGIDAFIERFACLV